MKRFLVAIVLLLAVAAPSSALTDKEYFRMRQYSAAYAKADKRINRIWANLRKSLPKKVFAELQELQSEWIDSGRDEAAQKYMDEGYSKIDAYVIATNERAEALPGIAEELRENLSTSRPSRTPKAEPKPSRKPAQRPTRKPEPDPEPEPEYEPEPEPEPEPKPKPEAVQYPPLTDEETEKDSPQVVDPSGEYETKECFMTVKVIDRSSMEVEVSFGRWKDEVSWKASGWYDNDILELSDSEYSTCQMTIYFDPDRARVVPSESEDWAKVTADDFKLRGTYTKKQ